MDGETLTLMYSQSAALSRATFVKGMGVLPFRDKVLRFVQYFAKGLSATLKDSGHEEAAGHCTVINKNMSSGRRAFRLGKWLDEIHKFMLVMGKGNLDMLTKLMKLWAHATMAGFLVRAGCLRRRHAAMRKPPPCTVSC